MTLRYVGGLVAWQRSTAAVTWYGGRFCRLFRHLLVCHTHVHACTVCGQDATSHLFLSLPTVTFPSSILSPHFPYLRLSCPPCREAVAINPARWSVWWSADRPAGKYDLVVERQRCVYKQ